MLDLVFTSQKYQKTAQGKWVSDTLKFKIANMHLHDRIKVGKHLKLQDMQ